MTVWIVDAMNVIGSRPTGWWRDRRAAVQRLLGASQRFAAIADDRVILVVDGRPGPALPEGEHDGVRVAYAVRTGPDAADDRIVELVASESAPSRTQVVTSSRVPGPARRASSPIVSASYGVSQLTRSSSRQPAVAGGTTRTRTREGSRSCSLVGMVGMKAFWQPARGASWL